MVRLVLILFYVTIQASSLTKAIATIKHHEGFKSIPYIDANHFSIGYGTNLKHGISRAEAEILLVHRLSILEQKLLQLKWYKNLSSTRKAVILDMTYNIGFTGILKFKGLIWCVKNNYYNAAGNHMLNSLWAKQVGQRAKTLAHIMKTGEN